MNHSKPPRILVLGITGMLGHVFFRRALEGLYLKCERLGSKCERLGSKRSRAGNSAPGTQANVQRPTSDFRPPISDLRILGTCRNLEKARCFFSPEEMESVFPEPVDAMDIGSIQNAIETFRPDWVVNCIGIIKQLPEAENKLLSIAVNALLPHQLAELCGKISAKLIHISTDCVFDGREGNYTEDHLPTCTDLYGRTKFLGEAGAPHAYTIRTSIIGHELDSHVSLIDWFLAQQNSVKGFTQAIYTGFPAVELADIMISHVIHGIIPPGLYQVSSEPINKFELLQLVKEVYGKDITIDPFDDFFCDRSLDSTRFRQLTGYVPPPWPELVKRMHESRWLSRGRETVSGVPQRPVPAG